MTGSREGKDPENQRARSDRRSAAQWPLIEIFSRTFSQGMNLDRFDRRDVVSRREGEGEGDESNDQ